MKTSVTADTIPAGTELFGYRIESVLGRGGMGTVYLAKQLSLNRQVALKVMNPKLLRNPKFIEDFTREARSAGKLMHQNLVLVHDLHGDPARNLFCYSMEYVTGQTVTRLVTEQGTLKRQPALHIVYQVAKALGCAHRAELIHRDIKPDNILVTQNGLAKVMDLGLVRDRLESRDQRSPGKRLLTLVGTPDYCAPEQLRNPDEATTASDVYSLGASLFYMLTGAPPFNGETVIDLVVRACMDQVQYPATITPDCRVLLDLMLAKDPNRRLPDGDAVVVALEDLAKGRTPKLPDEMTSGEYAVSASGSGLRTPLPIKRRRILRRYRYRR